MFRREAGLRPSNRNSEYMTWYDASGRFHVEAVRESPWQRSGQAGSVDVTLADRREDKAEQIASEIARRIVRGDYPPGTRLPGLRRLSKEFEASQATIRIALDSLESVRLVDMIPRAGTIARNPRSHAGLRAWALLANAPDGREFAKDRDWLRAYLCDALEFVEVAIGAVVRDLQQLDDRSEVQQAIDRLERLGDGTSADPLRTAMALLDIYRTVTVITGHPAYLGFVNELGGVLSRSPALSGFLARDPSKISTSFRSLLARLPGLDEPALEHLVDATSQRFKAEALATVDQWLAGPTPREGPDARS